MPDGNYTDPDSLRRRITRRVPMLKRERTSFEAHWRELAEHMMPRAGRWTLSDQNKGDKRNQKLIDGTPRFAARVLASGMMAGLTSPARPWFLLTTPDRELAEFAAVKTWLHDVTVGMRDVLSKSNFYKAAPACYGALGVFGTTAALGLEDAETLIRWYPQPTGTYWLAQSERLQVDTLYREMRWTVRQLIAKFGLAAVSDRVKQAFQRGDGETPVDIAHMIEPNTDYAQGRLGPAGKPIRSCWYELQSSEDRVLEESGYYESPLVAPRWEVEAGDIYGGSPGMDALGDAKALQFQQKRKAQAIDKAVDPPLQGPTSLRNQRISLLPGDVTYVDTQQTGGGLRSIYDVQMNPTLLLEDTAQIQERINTAFFADLFLMLAMSDRRQITAREVEERHEEKLLMLGPVLEQLNDEFLDPVIDRTFSVMLRAGRIPPPPKELQGMELKVEYVSILAQAQKRLGLGAVDRLTGFVGNLAAMKQDPSVFDKLDTDQTIDEYGEMCGVSPRLIVPDDQVAEIRAARQQQTQMQQMAAMAQPVAQAADAAATLGSTKQDPESLLAAMTGAIGGGGVPA